MVGVTVFVTTLILVLMLVADVVTALLDPRVREAQQVGLRLPSFRRRPAQASQPAQTFS